MGSGLIVQLNSNFFPYLMRGFFAPIVKFLFYLIECAIDIMYELAGHRFGLDTEIDKFTDNFFAIFVIYMIFRLTISMLSYIVNPDSFSDKNTGFSKLIIRIIISVVLLTSINPLFNLLYDIQDDLFGQENVIDNLILSDQEIYTFTFGDNDTQDIYTTQMSEYCPDGYTAYAFTKGELFSILALKPFYQPTDPSTVDDRAEWDEYFANNQDGYCGINIEKLEKASNGEQSEELPQTLYDMVDAPHGGSQYIKYSIYEAEAGNWDPIHDETFIIDFRYIWGIIFGIFMLLLIITYCFDLVIRACTLFLYQIIAPIPIIAYISPNKKETDMLGNWIKKVLGCWASLFVRFAILDFVIYFAQIVLSEFSNNDYGLVTQLFILVGLLMFAKKLPKLIEEVIPMLKFEGFQLNPLKRISQDAAGGNLLLGAGAALTAATMSGVSNLATGVENNLTGENKPGFGWNKGADIKENIKNNLSSAGRLAKGSAKTAGSVVAGIGSAGSRSFLKTSKNGDIIGGIKQGHGEAQFAKMQRADLERKGSTPIGRLAADANRWIGRENKAQRLNREILEDENSLKAAKTDLDARKNSINEEKTRLQNERDDKAKGFSKIKSQIEAYKNRLDSKGEVYLKDKDGNFVYEMDEKGNYVLDDNGDRKRVKVKIKDELDNLEAMKNTDYSMEVASRHENIKNIYQAQIDATTDATLKTSLETKMNEELASVTVDSVKQEHLKAQNDKINKMRDDYATGVKDGTYTDEVATQIMNNIEDIRQSNSAVAENVDIFTRDADGNAVGFNRGAVYSADDQIKIISNEYDNKIQVQEEKLYQINIEEQNLAAAQRDIERRKTDDEYIRAMADNAAQKVTQPQPENWLSSPNIESSSGYGGYQLHSKSGGTPYGGGGTPPPAGGGGPH